MVEARAQFLNAGHYNPLRNALTALCLQHGERARFITDLGTGTGFYISRILQQLPQSLGLAIDLSKYAARRAAKAHSRLDVAIADVWGGLPLKDGSADILLVVFAPRPANELFRIIKGGGRLIVATPADAHLGELQDSLGLLRVHPGKRAKTAQALSQYFVPSDHGSYHWSMQLTRIEVEYLVRMGPSARHVDSALLAGNIGRLPTITNVTGSVDISVYTRRE
jgi:23S rRNA (guanine745-N1)-methyltransferase